jgi:predicted 3-demethylubiquinone-9 3-methyltransferase (glyoxalase superfamily)
MEDARMQKIVTHLWFDSQAEEAARFYTSIFKNSKIGRVSRYSDAGAEVTGRPKGSVMTIEFELDGQTFYGLNGGPHFKFSEAISLFVNCKDQAEIDDLWNKLLAGGGQPQQCGWLKDRYGLCWQIVPTELAGMMAGEPAKAERVMKALLQMVKLDIAALKRAYEG